MDIVTQCRMCHSKNLEVFLNLEHHPLSDHFLFKKELDDPEVHYPLHVLICHDCGFVQLKHIVSPEVIYQTNYPYESSTTEMGKKHYYKMAEDICKEFTITSGSLVVDIGSNVGVLLSGFKEQRMKILGVEPANNIATIANKNGIETIPDFFSSEVASRIVAEKGKAFIATATNVFAHIGDLDAFMKALELLIDEKGLYVFEAPYLVELIDNLEYDTIYHEHLGYLSIKPLVNFFDRYGWEIIKVDRVLIHGGSIRVFVARKGMYTKHNSVQELLDLEKEKKIYSIDTLRTFAENVIQHRNELVCLLADLKQQGKRIVGVSAPAKGNTLLNYCKIGTQFLDYITEKSNLKIGTFSPGMQIPIKSDEELMNDKPDYALLLAWNFADEIMNNLKDFKKQGGKFIIPIPKPRII